MFNKHNNFWPYPAVLLVTNLTLLLPNANPLRIIGALLLIGFLPGFSWTNRFLADSPPLLRYTIAAALSYTFTVLATLLLHYLPGPVLIWQLVTVLDILAVLPIIIGSFGSQGMWPPPNLPQRRRNKISLPLLLILLIALFLRLANLPYSEFQGDESLAMISAAEALRYTSRATSL